MVSKITAIIESVPIWGDDNFDANVHENFLKLKELGPQLNKTVDEINKTFEDIDTYTKTATTQAGEAVQSASTANNAKQTATTQAEIATTQAGEASTSASNAASSAATATNEANKAKEYADSIDHIRFSEKLFDKPSKGPLFIKASASSIKIPSGFKVGVGSQVFKLATDYTLTLASNLLVPETKTAGTDYYVYAKANGTFYISSNKNITTDRLIGGFHYGLVGESEAATGNKTEADMVKIRGINAYSFWDLKYHPVANSDGMVCIGKKWYDIYLLNSEHITNGTSKAGLFIAGGAASTGRAIPKIPLEYGGNGTITYGKFTCFQACEIAKAHGKELISYAEFPTIAYGVLEGVSSSTNAYEVVAGKIEHYPALTSKYGIEQATGVQWIWGADLANGYGTTDFAWKDNADGRGQIYSTSDSPTAVMLGGGRENGVNAGSRASVWHHYVWRSDWSFGCRFACDHLELE